MSERQKIVVIGGVAAGPKAAARARRCNPDTEIVMLERGKMTSYAGCGLPFFISGMIHDFSELYKTSYGVARDEGYFGKEKNIKLYTRTEAVAVDREAKKVKAVNLETNEELEFEYDKLILATGATPFVPPIEGINLDGVYQLNHPDDALKINNALDTGEIENAVIVGAGLIGMESADALFNKMVEVTIVEFQNQVLPGLLDPDIAAKLQQHMYDEGATIYTGDKVLKIEGDESGKVKGVVTEKKGFIECQMVITAVGVRPNVKLAKEAGLEIGETGAILVNEYMQTSDPDIYACGDCVENIHLITGKKVYAPMATYANRHGRVVGDNVTGGNSKVTGILGTGVAEVFEMNIGRTGLGEVQAKNLGYDVVTTVVSDLDRTHYHPAHKLIQIKLIADAKTKRVLGAQGIGAGDVVKRIDVIAAAITFGAKVDDILNIDLGYAPPFSTPIDPLMGAASVIKNKEAGLAATITAQELKEKLERGDDIVVLDVRTADQFKTKHIQDDRVIQIALGDLRDQIDKVPKEKEIIVICPMGRRAYEASRILQSAGCKDAKFLEGGLNMWTYDLEIKRK